MPSSCPQRISISDGQSSITLTSSPWLMGATYGHSGSVAGLRAEPLTADSLRNSAIAEGSRGSDGGSQHIDEYSWRECAEVVVFRVMVRQKSWLTSLRIEAQEAAEPPSLTAFRFHAAASSKHGKHKIEAQLSHGISAILMSFQSLLFCTLNT